MKGQLLPKTPGLPDVGAKKETEPGSRMDLLFIPHSRNQIIKAGTIHDKREINRRAQKNASIKRKQARQDEAVRKAEAAPFRLFGDLRHPEPQHGSQTPSQEPEGVERPSGTTAVGSLHYYHAPSVTTYLDTGRVDPFDTGKIPMTPQMQSVFMWYFNVILPVVEPTQVERDDYSRWAVPLFGQKPALLYALLTCMAHDIEQSTVAGFGPPTRRNMTSERLQYKVKAIEALNESLADPTAAAEPSTLLAVHFLLWQEIFAGDECVHLDGVQRLLEWRGGFHGLQRKALEGVMLGCFWRAIRTRTKPTLPMVPGDFQLTDEQFSNILSKCDPAIARIGEAFQDPELSPLFDGEMFQLLQNARKAWVCFELIGVYDFHPEIKRQATIMRVNIDHRLLSYPFDHYGTHRPIQEAIRQAFVTFSSAHYCVVQPSSKIARCHIEDLQNALIMTDLKSCWGTASRALLWVLFHGAHLTFGQRERPWFVTALARVSQSLQLQTWIQTRAILVRFYYVDRVFQDSFRKIWEEVELVRNSLSSWF